MKNEEVIKVLEKMKEKLTYQGIVSYSNKDKQALTIVIETLKRIDVGKFFELIHDEPYPHGDKSLDYRSAQAIVNYLTEKSNDPKE